MKFCTVLLLALLMISGCATVDPNLQLSKDTKVAIIDATEDVLFSSSVALDSNAVKAITRRIMRNTKDKLSEYNIAASTEDNQGMAKVKYDIRTISGSYRVIGGGFGVIGKNKIEIKYTATLESPDGKKLFIYEDEQDDSDLDEVCASIGNKVAKRVARYIKQSD